MSADSNDSTTPPVANVFSLSGAREVATREEKGVKVFLKTETGEPLMTTDKEGAMVEAYAVVLGKFSNTYRKADKDVADAMLRKRTMDLTSDLLEQNELRKIAACVKDWNLRDGAREITSDVHNVVMVLNAAPWIRRDIESTMSDPSRFLA